MLAGAVRCVAIGVVIVGVGSLAAACSRKGAAPGGPDGAGARDVFRAGIVRPSSLDPMVAKTVDELLVADQLYDSLTAYDPSTLEPVASLAETWTASDDQRQWEFTLRPDAVFSDGSALTADDVKATFDRIARKDSGSSVSDLLELVSGYREVAVDGSASELSGVVVVSPSVVRIALDSPWSVLPSALASPAFGVVPKALVDTGGVVAASDSAVTSGPFSVVASDEPAVLAVVPAVGVTARSERLEFWLFDDKAAAYDALAAGRVDWSEVPPDRVAEAVEQFDDSLFRPYIAELFYAFNLRNPKFADIRVREAIVRAVDASSIISSVYESGVLPLDGVIVRGMAGHQDDPCAGRCSFDADRSAALVAELTAEGVAIPEVQIDYDDDPTQAAVATAIQADLAAVGIASALRPKPLDEYQQFAVSGGHELFRLGWIAPYPSPDAVLAPLFLTGFPNNLTGFSSAAVDEALQAARADPIASSRIASYQAAERAVMAELPIIPIAQFEIQSVASSSVRGLVVTATGTFDGRSVWVATDA